MSWLVLLLILFLLLLPVCRAFWRSTCESAFTFSQFQAETVASKVSERCRTKVRGVTFRNRDGTLREDIIIRKCREDDMLGLVREPKNRYDKDAIQVLRLVWTAKKKVSSAEQLGYISRELAVDLAPEMDAGAIYFARITALTGTQELRGVNLQILKVET